MITPEPRTGLEPRPSPGSHSPGALRPPPSRCPAALESSAPPPGRPASGGHAPTTPPQRHAPRRPRPPAAQASPGRRVHVRGGGGEEGRVGGVQALTWAAGECVRVWVGPIASWPPPVPTSSPRAEIPHRWPTPPGQLGAQGAWPRGGGAGRGPAGGGRGRCGGGRSPLPLRPRLEAAQRRPGTRWRDRCGAGRGLPRREAARAAAEAGPQEPGRPGLRTQTRRFFNGAVPQFPHLLNGAIHVTYLIGVLRKIP